MLKLFSRRTPPLCLRCKSVELRPDAEEHEGIAFYDCPSCHRRYAQKPGAPLTYRWLDPISLVLYEFLFRSAPAEGHVTCAVDFIFNEIRQEKREVFVREIEEELHHATQPVSRILNGDRTELQCRAFLAEVTTAARTRMASGGEGSPFWEHDADSYWIQIRRTDDQSLTPAQMAFAKSVAAAAGEMFSEARTLLTDSGLIDGSGGCDAEPAPEPELIKITCDHRPHYDLRIDFLRIGSRFPRLWVNYQFDGALPPTGEERQGQTRGMGVNLY